MSNNPPPDKIYLQWDGDAETPEPCTDDPDDRDVTWCRERVFAQDIQFERSDLITELKREIAVWKHEVKRLEAELKTFDETAIEWWCEYQDLKAKAREP